EKEQIIIGDQQPTQTSSTTESNTVSDGEIVEIRLTGDDQMRFDKNEIKVKAGQTVRLTFEHVGQMAKNVMGHNFVLLTQRTDIKQYGNEAVQAADNEYIPQNTNKVIDHTRKVGGDESVTIVCVASAHGA